MISEQFVKIVGILILPFLFCTTLAQETSQDSPFVTGLREDVNKLIAEQYDISSEPNLSASSRERLIESMTERFSDPASLLPLALQTNEYREWYLDTINHFLKDVISVDDELERSSEEMGKWNDHVMRRAEASFAFIQEHQTKQSELVEVAQVAEDTVKYGCKRLVTHLADRGTTIALMSQRFPTQLDKLLDIISQNYSEDQETVYRISEQVVIGEYLRSEIYAAERDLLADMDDIKLSIFHVDSLLSGRRISREVAQEDVDSFIETRLGDGFLELYVPPLTFFYGKFFLQFNSIGYGVPPSEPRVPISKEWEYETNPQEYVIGILTRVSTD